MSLSRSYNIGAHIRTVTALAPFATTQTSAGLSTTQDGITIDRTLLGRRYYSCKSAVVGAFTAGSSQRSATLTLNFQHSSDGTSWDNFSTGTVPTPVVWGATSSGNAAGSTGGTEYDSVEQSVNLNGARRYIRMQVPNPTFQDCSSGVILSYAGAIVFGGADELPAI